jgi:hypothetical protein
VMEANRVLADDWLQGICLVGQCHQTKLSHTLLYLYSFASAKIRNIIENWKWKC